MLTVVSGTAQQQRGGGLLHATKSTLASPALVLRVDAGARAKRKQKKDARPPVTDEVAVHGARFGSRGGVLATCHFDATVRLWAATGEYPCVGVARCGAGGEPLLQVDVNRRETEVAAASASGSAFLVDVETLEVKEEFRGHGSYVNGVAWLANECGLLATSSDDATVQLWDARAGSATAAGAAGTVELPREATAVAAHALDEMVLYSGCLDGRVRVHDLRKLADGPTIAVRAHSDICTSIAAHPDGRARVVSYGLDGYLVESDVDAFASSSASDRISAKVAHAVPAAGATSFVLASTTDRSLVRCAYNARGTRIAVGATSVTKFAVSVYDFKLNPLFALPGHTGVVVDAAFHPTEPVLATCGMDNRVLVGEIPPEFV